MTHSNRDHIAVNTSGNWRLYSNTLPENGRAIGTVTRGDIETGVLVLIEPTGEYVQVNAGSLKTLDQRKVKIALGIVSA